jgi:hypothetical protein
MSLKGILGSCPPPTFSFSLYFSAASTRGRKWRSGPHAEIAMVRQVGTCLKRHPGEEVGWESGGEREVGMKREIQVRKTLGGCVGFTHLFSVLLNSWKERWEKAKSVSRNLHYL